MEDVEYTWTHSDTSVTTKNITTASPSTFSPMSTMNEPERNRNTDRMTGSLAAVPICVQQITEMMKLAATAVIPSSAPLAGRRLPKKTMRKNEMSGSDGMIQAYFSMESSHRWPPA